MTLRVYTCKPSSSMAGVKLVCVLQADLLLEALLAVSLRRRRASGLLQRRLLPELADLLPRPHPLQGLCARPRLRDSRRRCRLRCCLCCLQIERGAMGLGSALRRELQHV